MAKIRCTNQEIGIKLLDYEQGWLSQDPLVQEMVRIHLTECQACTANLDFFRPLWKLLREHQEVLKSRKKTARRRSFWRSNLKAMIVAATALILLTSGLHSYRAQLARQSRFAALAVVDKVPYEIGLMRSPGEASRLFYQGMQFFQQEDYKNAIEKIRAAVQADPENAMFQYYLGYAHMLDGTYRQAVLALEASSLRSKGSLHADAQWYLGNAYLKVGRIADAQRVFESLAATKGRRAALAHSILAKMNTLQHDPKALP